MVRRSSEMPLSNCKPCVACRSPVRCDVGSKKSFDAGSGNSCSTPTYVVCPETAYNPGASVEACARAISESQSASTTIVWVTEDLRSARHVVSRQAQRAGYLARVVGNTWYSEASTMRDFASLYLRFALGLAFLYSVADRFGLLGGPGANAVSWGTFSRFSAYVATL